MSELKAFGDYLKAARQRKGLSLRAVEESVSISNAYLSQLEQGKIKQPSPVVLYKLSQLYEFSYSDVMQMFGYPMPDDSDGGITAASRIGPVTDEEEEELIDYLKFLRSKRNKGN